MKTAQESMEPHFKADGQGIGQGIQKLPAIVVHREPQIGASPTLLQPYQFQIPSNTQILEEYSTPIE